MAETEVTFIWSWLLAAVGILGLFLAGSKKKIGWAIGAGSQILWIAYATVTHQWGFYVSAIVYGLVYIRNFLAWYREEKIEASSV